MPSSYTIGKHFEAFIQSQLASGRYGNASEVMRDALRLMEERERQCAAFDAAIMASVADADVGRVHDAEEVFSELIAKYEAMAEPKGFDARFRLKVQTALDDQQPAILNDGVKTHFARRRATAQRKAADQAA